MQRSDINCKTNFLVNPTLLTKSKLIFTIAIVPQYSGRVEEDGKKGDRFYYLRDLPIENEKLN